ncbi:hypothetical protein pb186bvf_002028 [Paramecium bursaria]
MDNQFDSELQTYFHNIKHEIRKEHIDYLVDHPELKQILNDFTSQILLEKVTYLKLIRQPENIYKYAQDYFCFFNHDKDLLTSKPLVISGPSGVGKGTLLQRLLKDYPNTFGFSVSYTTRAPRPGEVQGVNYFFVSKEEFLKEMEKSAFLESGDVHGNFYGTHKAQVNKIMKEGKICLLEIDVGGAAKVNQQMPDLCNFLFISTTDPKQIEDRLRKRGTETEEVIQKRLNNAIGEKQRAADLGIYTTIYNDEFEPSYAKLVEYLAKLYPNQKMKLYLKILNLIKKYYTNTKHTKYGQSKLVTAVQSSQL